MIDLTEFFQRFDIGFGLAIIALLLTFIFWTKFPEKNRRGSNTMATSTVSLILKNPQNPDKQAEGEFLVDSGAHYTVVPAAMVKLLGLKPSHVQRFSLADGRIMKRAIGGCIVRLDRRELPVAVVLGEKDDSALLGVTTLENFGLMLDPFKREIYPSRLMLG